MAKHFNGSIPLQCSLCPKNPTFSDISHLLTHISSKSHLSHRFKLQIRSQGEPEARQVLDKFETWYAENGMEDLLSERMMAKDQKKLSKKARVSNTKAKLESIKRLPLMNITSPPVSLPRMHTWPIRGSAACTLPTVPISDWDGSFAYTSPTAIRHLPNFGVKHTPVRTRAKRDSTPTRQATAEIDDESGTLTDSARLKGILWPGMSLFDSATPEMKRMRNQRKDGSILEQMIVNSAGVEANEVVYFADGGVYKVKGIYDSSVESSPIRSEKQPSAKKRGANRKLRSKFNSNARRSRFSYKIGSPPRDTPGESKAESQEHEIPKSREHLPGDPVYNTYNPDFEAEEEYRLTIEENVNQKHVFGIFQDNDERSPGRTESPLEAASFESPSHGLNTAIGHRSHEAEACSTVFPKSESTSASSGHEISSYLVERHTQHLAAFAPQPFLNHSVNPLWISASPHQYTYAQTRAHYQEPVIERHPTLNSKFKSVDNIDHDFSPKPRRDFDLRPRPDKRVNLRQ